MKRFSDYISQHPWLVLLIAIAVAIPAGIAAISTPINYDIFSYMPESVEAIKGQLIMKDDFKTADTAFLMLETADTAQVLKVKDDISEIEGVEKVTWISDLVDPSIPDFIIPEEILGAFKKEGNSLIHISFATAAVTDETQEAVARIKEYLGEGKALTGMPVFVYELKALMEQQKTRSILTAVVISAIMTAFATGSAIVPILFLTSIGIGIIYNMGTNFLMGSISYLTGAVAAVIQLGVTFDFSIFLMQRFREECLHNETEAEAMSAAIQKTFGAICPAALTTIAGFMALSFMKVRIGLDMGVVMSKGVLMGLIASVTVLPSLTLIFHRFMKIRDVESTAAKHQGVARWIADHSGVLSLVFILIFLPAVFCKSNTELSYSVRDMMPEQIPAITAIEDIEGAMGSIEIANVLFPSDVPRWEQKETLEEIEKLPTVMQAISLPKLADPAIPDSFIPEKATDEFIKGGYSNATLKLSVKPGTDEANQCIADIRNIINERGIEGVYVTGTSATSKDLTDISTTDIKMVNLISFFSILLIVTIVFASGSIPIILILGIELAIFINLAIPFLFGHTVPYVTFTSISAIQLGTTVDYAILLMTRYKQERKDLNPHDALVRTIAGTTPAILTSGMSLFAATIGLVFISDVGTVKSMALMIGRGALISMSVIVILLPAVIMKCDKIITMTSRGWRKSANN